MNLKSAPFHLDDNAIAWVDGQLAQMSVGQKLAQLICILLRTDDAEEIAALQSFGVGGMVRMATGSAQEERALRDGFNAKAPVPLLVAADLEGSRMTTKDGVVLPNPLGLAAIDDVEVTEQVSDIWAANGQDFGINWTFTPLLDINAAFRSAIVATRSFGSDLKTIRRHALAQIERFQANNVAATIKHWPGEGYDDRDQHLVTTINPLSIEEWEETFGRLYRDAIDAGVLSVMSAHIAFPAYVRSLGHEEDAFRPATINRHLNQTLLRETLGFEGVIVSDATPMAGLTGYSARRDHLAEIISNGCDMILFTPDVAEDLHLLQSALDEGALTIERVDESVRRLLALKARLGLHRQPVERAPRDRQADQQFADRVHARVPTLVKDKSALLPLNIEKHRRVLILSSGIVMPFVPHPIPFALPDMLRAEGFEPTMFEPGMEIDPADYDLMLFLLGEETLLTRGHIFLDWLRLTGNFGKAMERHWHDIPTAMISFGYPYYLYDAPAIPTYINAYASTEAMQRAVADALLGRTPWNKNSPVDPFCGLDPAAFA